MHLFYLTFTVHDTKRVTSVKCLGFIFRLTSLRLKKFIFGAFLSKCKNIEAVSLLSVPVHNSMSALNEIRHTVRQN